MENVFFYVQNIVLYFFYLSIAIFLLNFISSSFCFTMPMKKKYKIFTDDLYNNIHLFSICDFCIVSIIYITFLLFFLYKLNIWIFIITSFGLLLYFTISSNHYKNCNILDFVNNYSEDLFDWHKIYDLDIIDEDTKKNCFAIHNINYEDFKFKHLTYLRLKRFDIQSKIDKISICPFCKETTKPEWSFCNNCGNKLK